MARRAAFAALAAATAATAFAGVAAAQGIPRADNANTTGRASSPFLTDFGGKDPLARGAGFEPYVELTERANVTGDFRLFGELTAGASAFINRDRAQGTAYGRFTYRQTELGRSTSRFTANGLARGTFDVIRNRGFLDLSAFASATPTDSARGITIDPQNQNGNLTQVYLISATPRVRREIGTFAIGELSYKATYISISNRLGGGGGGTSGGGTGSSGNNAGGLELRPLSDTFTQTVEGSLANQPRDGRLSVKLSLRGSEETQKRLDQRFRSGFATFDATYALTRPLALVGSAGYQDYTNTEQAILRAPIYVTVLNGALLPPLAFVGDTNPKALTPYYSSLYRGNVLITPSFTDHFGVVPPGLLANGFTFTRSLADPNLFHDAFFGGAVVRADDTPVLTKSGDFQGDPTRPRQTTYSQRGLVWNAGFRYTPSRRSLLELRLGQRFSDVTVTGSVRQQFRNGLLVTGSVTDGIETFSSILTTFVDGVSPVSFVSNGRTGGGLGGCVGSSGGSRCLQGAAQSVSSGVFRSRIAQIGVDWDRGATTYSLEYSYNNRRYLNAGASTGPDAPVIDPTLVSREDVQQRIFARATHRLDTRQTIQGGVFVGEYDLGLSRRTSDSYVGADARYNIRLNKMFDVFASASLTQRFSGRIGNNLFSSLAVGARYSF